MSPLVRSVVAFALLFAPCACARAPSVTEAHVAPSTALAASDGRAHPVVDPASRFTVIEFFSPDCPCQTNHDARLRALAAEYAPRGVAFVSIDSEVGTSVARAQAEAAHRAYPFPILVDEGGAVARALGAEYATYVVLVDAAGNVVYAGGIDSDRTHLRDDATPYLRDAIDDALAARPLRRATAKALGCTLTLR